MLVNEEFDDSSFHTLFDPTLIKYSDLLMMIVATASLLENPQHQTKNWKFLKRSHNCHNRRREESRKMCVIIARSTSHSYD